MRAIFKKEWLGHFRNLTGWIYLSVTLFFLGWYFRQYGLTKGYPYLSYELNAVLFIFIFTLPLITMRSFAEEKRHHTDQLLFTSPVPVWQIVVGKYLAAVCVYLPVFPVLLIYPLILRIYGPVPLAENILAVVTFFFFGLAALGIGVLISALTENQLIAAVLTFFVLLLSAMTGSISGLISREGNAFTEALRFLDLTRPFKYSLYGVLHWPDHVFYLSVAGLCLFFADYALTVRRFHVQTQGVMGALSSLFKALLVFVAVIALNLFLRNLPSEAKRIDLSYNGINSITETTKQTLAGLDKAVQIYVLCDPEDKDEAVSNTLERMQEASAYIKIDYVDPAEQPDFYLNYADAQPAPGSIIVCGTKKSRVVDYYDCFQLSYDYAYDVASGGYVTTDYTVSGYDGEGKILSAILYVTSEHVPKIYCLSGHEEFVPENELESRIANSMYELESINLLQHEDIPDDGDIVFLLAPLRDLNDEDLEKLKRFLDKGKGAVFATAYSETAAEPEKYYSLLAEYGIEVLPGLVCETDPKYYNNSGEYLLPKIVEDKLTEGIYTAGRTRFVYMPYAKGLKLHETADVSARTFLSTGDKAYVDLGRDKEEGPFSLGVLVTRYLPEGVSRAVCFSSDYFLSQDINRAVNGSNYDLFMKCLSAVSETEDAVDVPVKAYAYDPILVGNGARDVCSLLFILLLPGVLLVAGTAIWYYRRKG
ncbi:MAG: Gldg family protein [Lachnospiraceae bacterium]|nr:Gldg family protein [Lachnospiraceae bacterium]